MEKEIIWQAGDHVHTKKEVDWFWALWILATSASIVAILFHNYFFALLVLIAAFTIALLAKRESRSVTFKLDATGLTSGAEYYKWEIINAFWIDTTDDTNNLLIDTTKILAPHLFIPIPANRMEDIRIFLSKYVKEEELHEPFPNKIAEFFGL